MWKVDIIFELVSMVNFDYVFVVRHACVLRNVLKAYEIEVFVETVE